MAKKRAASPAPMEHGERKVPVDPGMEELRLTLNSLGWKRVIDPSGQAWLQKDIQTLTSLKRPEGVTDDFIRGCIFATERFLTGFHKGLKDHDNKRAAKLAELARSVEEPPIGSIYAPEADPLAGTEND
jgi:hypothetical protein